MSCAVTIQRDPCLVLNKSWAPIGSVTFQKAITMLFSEYSDGEPKARIIDHDTFQTFTWDDWSKLRPHATDEKIKSGNFYFKVPKVIVLSRYDKIPKTKIHFSRRNLFKRDKMTCQFCGSRPGSSELTIDHVTPKAQGGVTSWENCILACVKCNSKKGNRTPQQAKMKLKKQPEKPRGHYLKYQSFKPIKSWSNFLGQAYWNCELENDMND